MLDDALGSGHASTLPGGMTGLNRNQRRAQARSARAGGTGRQPVEATLMEIERLVAAGHHDRADRALDRLLAGAPDLAAGWHLKGTLALLRDDAGTAVRALERAADLAPRDPAIVSNLGIAHDKAGSVAAARAIFEGLVARMPAFAPGHLNLGVLVREQGDPEAAITHFRAAVRHQPGYAKAWLELARTLRGRRRLAEALACLAHLGDGPEVCEERAECERARGDFAAAERSFRTSLAADPESIPARLGLGGCLQEQGRLDEALEVYREVLKRDPGAYSAVVKGLAAAAKGRLWLRPRELRGALLGPAGG
jgi:protein O-GlcNAc transferase